MYKLIELLISEMIIICFGLGLILATIISLWGKIKFWLITTLVCFLAILLFAFVVLGALDFIFNIVKLIW